MASRVKQLGQKVRHLERKVGQVGAALEQAHEIIERQQKEIEQLREENRILGKRLYGPRNKNMVVGRLERNAKRTPND